MSAHPHIRDLARRRQNEATAEERRLWAMLSGLNRQRRAHFRRQAPIGASIVAFADLSRRLVIDLDGGQHAAPDADSARALWLEKQGFRVLRFWTEDVTHMPEAVFATVIEALGPPPDRT